MIFSRSPISPGIRKSVMLTRYYRVAQPGNELIQRLRRLFQRGQSRPRQPAPQPCPIRQRLNALQALGLRDPVGPTTIRRRYRQLAMRHHPDRGGDIDAFIHVQQAMATLRRLAPSSRA